MISTDVYTSRVPQTSQARGLSRHSSQQQPGAHGDTAQQQKRQLQHHQLPCMPPICQDVASLFLLNKLQHSSIHTRNTLSILATLCILALTLCPYTQATIMTDPGMADATYVGPMTPELVEQILDKVRAAVAAAAAAASFASAGVVVHAVVGAAVVTSMFVQHSSKQGHTHIQTPPHRHTTPFTRASITSGLCTNCITPPPPPLACLSAGWQERPDAILPTMGGQTGLNLAKTMAENGMLDKYGVELIGAKLPSIDRAEDRELFKQAMVRIGLKTPPRCVFASVCGCVLLLCICV
jgi:hypothetical protein